MPDLDRARLEGLTVTMRDVVAAGHCAIGAKRWCADNGIDFREFVKHGLPATLALELGDAVSLQVVARKLEREGK